nr:TRF-like 2 [Tanacetum cinerariifolium]
MVVLGKRLGYGFNGYQEGSIWEETTDDNNTKNSNPICITVSECNKKPNVLSVYKVKVEVLFSFKVDSDDDENSLGVTRTPNKSFKSPSRIEDRRITWSSFFYVVGTDWGVQIVEYRTIVFPHVLILPSSTDIVQAVKLRKRAGDLTVTLKDPSGINVGTIYHKVLTEGGYGKEVVDDKLGECLGHLDVVMHFVENRIGHTFDPNVCDFHRMLEMCLCDVDGMAAMGGLDPKGVPIVTNIAVTNEDVGFSNRGTDGEAMINSIQNGDQPLPVIAQVSLAGTAQNAPPTLKDPKFWTVKEKKTRKINRLARSLLIQGLPNDIYSLIDSNETAKDLWDALERRMGGSEYGEQDRKAVILYEYETFKANAGEQLLDTYLRYL